MKVCVIAGFALGSAAIALALDPQSMVLLLVAVVGALIQIGLQERQKR